MGLFDFFKTKKATTTVSKKQTNNKTERLDRNIGSCDNLSNKHNKNTSLEDLKKISHWKDRTEAISMCNSSKILLDMASSIHEGDKGVRMAVIKRLYELCQKDNTILSATNSDGNSLLHLAINNDEADIAIKLIEMGINIDKTGKYDDTPLIRAAGNLNQCSAGMINVVIKLLEAGAHINHQNQDDWTAIHHAISFCTTTAGSVEGHDRILNELLKDKEINLSLKGKNIGTPLEHAERLKDKDNSETANKLRKLNM